MACISSLCSRVKGPFQAKLGSLSGLCREKDRGHENFQGLEVKWLFLLIVVDNLKIESNNLNVQNSQFKA